MLPNIAIGLGIGFVVIVIVSPKADAYCTIDVQLRHDSSCNYKGHVIQSGYIYKSAAPDCMECMCIGGVMDCCGYGKKADVMNIEGCRKVDHPYSCEWHFVDAYNSYLPCRPYFPWQLAY